MRAIFFGTPEFAVPCLQTLNRIADIQLVICQPDRPAGRGMKLSPPPVKRAAQSLGLPVEQPTKVRTQGFAERLRQLQADVAVVVAYGRILPRAVLEAPRLGCVNVHASLLPKLRGAAPIQWAIVRGERETGVCLMKMDEGMDTGPEIARSVLSITQQDTAATLSLRLAEAGAQLLSASLAAYVSGELTPRPQDHSAATMAPMLQKSDGLLDFERSAQAVHDRVRGLDPWPGAFAFLDGKRVKILAARVLLSDGVHGQPGQLLRAGRHGIEVSCGQGVVVIDALQLEGRKRMTAEQFCAGQTLRDGMVFAKA